MSRLLLALIVLLAAFTAQLRAQVPNYVGDPTVASGINSPIPLQQNGTATGTIGPIAYAPDINMGVGNCTSNCANTTLLGPFDTQNMASFSYTVLNPGTGTSAFWQSSNDSNCALATNWSAGNGTASVISTPSVALGLISQVLTANLQGRGPIPGKCLRLQITTYGSGTVSVEGWMRAAPINTIVTIANGVSPLLGTTGGWTTQFYGALSTTVQATKAGGGQLSYLQCYNPNASAAFVQVFNVASGSVTLGTTAPNQSYEIPQSSASTPVNIGSPGLQFSTAISMAATTTATGSTAPGTALVCNVGYF